MKALDTLIHLGAGPCREFEAHLASGTKRLVLVEADPQLTESLRSRAQGLTQVSVTQAALAPAAGAVTFHRYNLPDAGSLQPATGLHNLFPGLKLQEKLPLQALGLGDFINSLALAAEGHHRLIIDLPGQEMASLMALADASQLQGFRQLDLHCGNQPLYEQAVAAEEILGWLGEQGFDLIERDDAHDPDRPRWTFQRNALLMELKAARAEISRQTQLAAERAEELKKTSQAGDQARDQAQAQLAELTKARDAAKAEAEKQTKSAAQHKAEAEKQAQLATQHAGQLAERDQAQATLARDNGVILRLQQLRDADLKDLQLRYAQVLEQKNKQDALLKQLTERLTAASGYLHQLEHNPSDDTRKLTKHHGKSSKKRKKK
ncbi:hypothetical protein [Thiorhodovibrio frisius]|uniref:Methyltransferase FkbM domain-containing protein n=1 Tax=Thiorhodovibrio frisius TaxID=631362 RepID=H8YWA1_9GAMM|nr:hypothetical protein [Thiorhodovibrio frisius]EIC23704.1 hypothetical protein Thi970DRAFT_00203 [Thiorhodovibrio frisius]WPL20093.1 hypothetical protein Thiofri_00149 [Thiorhodovibrio frisius]